MPEGDLEVGFAVNDKTLLEGFRRAEGAAARAGTKISQGGARGAEGWGRLEKGVAKTIVGIRAMENLVRRLTQDSELWKETNEKVNKAIGGWTDDALRWMRGLREESRKFHEGQDATKRQLQEVDRAFQEMIASGLWGFREVQAAIEDLEKIDPGHFAEAMAIIKENNQQVIEVSVDLKAHLDEIGMTAEEAAAALAKAWDTEAIRLYEAQLRLNQNELRLTDAAIEAVVDRMKELQQAARELARVQSFDGFKKGFQDAVTDMKNLENVGAEVAQGMQSSFKTFFFDAFRKGVFDAQALLLSLLDVVLNVVSNLAAGQATAGLGSLFGFAGGGSVSPTGSYVVGERGPEIFTPERAGTIVPIQVSPQGGGGVVIQQTINVNAQGAAANDPKLLAGEIRRAMREELLHLAEHDMRVRGAFH